MEKIFDIWFQSEKIHFFQIQQSQKSSQNVPNNNQLPEKITKHDRLHTKVLNPINLATFRCLLLHIIEWLLVIFSHTDNLNQTILQSFTIEILIKISPRSQIQILKKTLVFDSKNLMFVPCILWPLHSEKLCRIIRVEQ